MIYFTHEIVEEVPQALVILDADALSTVQLLKAFLDVAPKLELSPLFEHL